MTVCHGEVIVEVPHRLVLPGTDMPAISNPFVSGDFRRQEDPSEYFALRSTQHGCVASLPLPADALHCGAAMYGAG